MALMKKRESIQKIANKIFTEIQQDPYALKEKGRYSIWQFKDIQ